jgi:hypothetical protein
MIGTLTPVVTVFVAQRCNVYLRFDRPSGERVVDTRRRVLMVATASVFCRIRWQANAYGTTVWQLAILQALAHGECMQRIAGICAGRSVAAPRCWSAGRAHGTASH